jgi:hypothetical protein
VSVLDLTIPGDAAQQKVLTRLTGLCNSIAPEDLCEGEYVSPRLSLFEELQGLLDPRALAVFLRGLPPLELTLGEVRAYRGVDGSNGVAQSGQPRQHFLLGSITGNRQV